MFADLNFTLLCSSLNLDGLFLFFLFFYKHLKNTSGIISENGILISWTHLPFELAFLRTFLFITTSKNQFLEANFF